MSFPSLPISNLIGIAVYLDAVFDRGNQAVFPAMGQSRWGLLVAS
jgi:hypothetical protein